VYQLWRVHTTFQKYDVWSATKALMSKCFWSYNYRLITTAVQQHENLQLIVASQVDQLWQHVVTHSSPDCPHQQTSVAKYPFHRSRGGRRTEDFLAMDAALWTRHCVPHQPNGLNFASQFHASWVTKTESPCSQVPRPRPRPRLEGSKTKTKTKTLRFQDQDWDQEL